MTHREIGERHLKNPVRLTKAQVQPASQVLAGAFQDGALFAHLIPDTSERKKKLPHLLETAVRSGFYYGKVYTASAKLEGVAVWLSPGNTDLSLGKQIRTGMFSLIFRVVQEAIIPGTEIRQWAMLRGECP